jgi:hypothetical protein
VVRLLQHAVYSGSAPESFCIRDASGQALAYVYFEDEPGRQMYRLGREENSLSN